MKASELIDIISNSNIDFLPFEMEQNREWEKGKYYYLYKKEDKIEFRSSEYGENIKQGNFINYASKDFLDKIFGEERVDKRKTIRLIVERK